MSNFIPNKKIDDREPTWFERKPQSFIIYKNQIYKYTPDRQSNHEFQFHFRYIQISFTQKCMFFDSYFAVRALPLSIIPSSQQELQLIASPF